MGKCWREGKEPSWVLERMQREIALNSTVLRGVVDLRAILDEAIEDVQEAFHVNATVKSERHSELARLDAEVARNELALLREKYARIVRSRRECEIGAYLLCGDVSGDAIRLSKQHQKYQCVVEQKRQLEIELNRLLRLDDFSHNKCELDDVERQGRVVSTNSKLVSTLKVCMSSSNDQSSQLGLAEFSSSSDILHNRGLLFLDDRLLLKIFSFLTAWSVMASAQANQELFLRVDSLFGIGSSVVITKRSSSVRSVCNHNTLEDNALSTGTAAAVASKLTAAEIKGIIALDDHARKLEVECSVLRAEKEDLAAALKGTETVKEFLASKLRQTETYLAASHEATLTAQRQQRSDQEVIHFLDARSCKLESDHRRECALRHRLEVSITREREEATAKLREMEHSYNEVVVMHGKSLQDARKKQYILIREVKALRLQLKSIQHIVDASTLAHSK